jgi:conjugative transfer pilus assembly protein TraH
MKALPAPVSDNNKDIAMKMKRFLVMCTAFCTMGLPLMASASLQSQMNDWFGDSGYTNSAGAGAYQSQMGGYYTGGNMSLRVPTRTIGNWVSVQPPKFEGGCGGIDLDLGGFNMVNKDAIVQQLRAIGQNAKALAFTMAIKYISSLLGSSMETIKGFADGLNKMQLDSCEAAASMLAFAGDGIGEMMGKEKEGCIQVQVAKNGLSYDEARTACTSGGSRSATNAAEKNIRHFTDGNVAWFVMMESPWLRTDLDTAEILMNLTGTIVVQRDPAGGASAVGQPLRVPAMAAKSCSGTTCTTIAMETLLDALVFGDENKGLKGDIYLVKCDSSTRTGDKMSCSTLANNGEPEKVDFDSYDSMKKKVKVIVQGIYDKVYQRDVELTNEEKAFIETVAAPIYRYILSSASAFRRTNPAQDYMLDKYLDAISKDIVATNLASMLDNVKYSMSMETNNPETDGYKKDYLESVETVQTALMSVREKSVQEMNYVVEMQERSQQYERVIVSRMSAAMLSSAMFAQ